MVDVVPGADLTPGSVFMTQVCGLSFSLLMHTSSRVASFLQFLGLMWLRACCREPTCLDCSKCCQLIANCDMHTLLGADACLVQGASRPAGSARLPSAVPLLPPLC